MSNERSRLVTTVFELPVNRLKIDSNASLLEQLVIASRLLGTDRTIANEGGGNTSVKSMEVDHVGRSVHVLWVKGSGTDLATIGRQGFAGLRLDELLPLIERESMSDEEMVSYLAKSLLDPSMPRPSIETLLHAFVPFRRVDHTHPDAINAICCTANGERLAQDCFGNDAIWIPYERPGFSLARRVGLVLQERPSVKCVLLAKHGLVTWGNSAEECHEATIVTIARAAEFVNQRAKQRPTPAIVPVPHEKLHSILPVLRGALAETEPKIFHVDTSPTAAQFVSRHDAHDLSQVGAACPDHLVNTRMRPLWIDRSTLDLDADERTEHIRGAVSLYRSEYRAYVERNGGDPSTADDPSPRVVVIDGVGIIGVGADERRAILSCDLYLRAIAVMTGASAIDVFVSLDETESYAIEYWPLERYKLSLRPAQRELAGKVALITGGAGGIGSAIAQRLAAEGAHCVVADLNVERAKAVVCNLPSPGLAVELDVTSEQSVAHAFDEAIGRFGGVDVVVSNAGIASSTPIESTTIDDWRHLYEVLGTGYFLVAREAFRVLKNQGTGGSVVFIGSKNGLVAGKNAAAYSSVKAAELHLARCLAEEGGESGIRVNVVNPDAVIRGSSIWSSAWRQERARAYGIEPDELEEHYRKRTVLKVNVFPEDIAEATVYFASDRRSGKSTGNVLNVDGGVTAAYPR